jgi:lysophospholipase L1-like esterase
MTGDTRRTRRATAAALGLGMLAIAATPSVAGDGQAPAAPRPGHPQATQARQSRATTPTATAERWVATWGTALQLARIAGGPAGRGSTPGGQPGTPAAHGAAATPVAAPSVPMPPPPSSQGFPPRRFGAPVEIPQVAEQTVRMIVRTSIGGRRVRIRLANAFGAATVTIGAAHVARRQEGSAIVAGSDRRLTFDGEATARIYAGQSLLSDPVDLDVAPLSDLAVSLYIAGDAGAPTAHRFGLRPTYISARGNHAAAARIEPVEQTTESYYWLAGVDVLAPAGAGTIVTFGDSITDGDQSTPDTNRMWPARLAERLQASAATRQVAVVNAGIAGNRLLGDNNGGVVRFVAHALSVPGVRWITVLEGINDITIAGRRFGQPPATAPGAVAAPAAPPFSADDLIDAYRQMIAAAHAEDIRVIGCTLTPFGGSSAYSERGEAIRQAVNDWIRTSGAFDAVVDFDAVTRDRTDPQRFSAEAESPDLLHPGDGGYRVMAEAFDLALFASPAAVPAPKR